MLFHALENLEQMFYNLDIMEKGMNIDEKRIDTKDR